MKRPHSMYPDLPNWSHDRIKYIHTLYHYFARKRLTRGESAARTQTTTMLSSVQLVPQKTGFLKNTRQSCPQISASRNNQLHARCSKGVRTHTGLVRGGRSLQNSIISAASAAGAPVVSQIDENSILDAVIVGGGISGLTTALVRCDKVWIEH